MNKNQMKMENKKTLKSIFFNKKTFPILLLVFFLFIFLLKINGCVSLSNNISLSYVKITAIKAAPYGRESIHYVFYYKEGNKEISGKTTSLMTRKKVNVGDIFVCSYDNSNPIDQLVYWDKKLNDKNIDIIDKVPKDLIENDELSLGQILECALQ